VPYLILRLTLRLSARSCLGRLVASLDMMAMYASRIWWAEVSMGEEEDARVVVVAALEFVLGGAEGEWEAILLVAVVLTLLFLFVLQKRKLCEGEA
jgi:hypothetical protein